MLPDPKLILSWTVCHVWLMFSRKASSTNMHIWVTIHNKRLPGSSKQWLTLNLDNAKKTSEFYVQVGLNGENTSLYTEAGSSTAKWGAVAPKRPLTWYKVSIIICPDDHIKYEKFKDSDIVFTYADNFQCTRRKWSTGFGHGQHGERHNVD